MPAQYEAIRNRFVKQGLPLKEAKTRAAKIYNAKHPSTPVGRYSDEKPHERVARRMKTKT